MKIGEYIKSIRESKGMGLRELARRSGISPTHLSNVEAGLRDNPKLDTLKKIAIGLNHPVENLIVYAGTLEDNLYYDVEKLKYILESLPSEYRKDFMEKIDLLADVYRAKRDREKKIDPLN
ncbi:helix-turn-helix transcriptional regulator [Brevibacillus laterosporus]|uniref:helix-turn-helix domain-containing protein n=1 Tax=Brevibacillus laterosporus TaxID=1465 RepID=UPI0011260B40|nr:helix-turn-helix transcriptional regulator [Brevibacillus laterosporus]MED1790981.1 helix-turn-helix transcriptional regulator [Brevibacillus laterosporus]MED4762065.1 helix-turn-helix transcriptional regulator [Brevibacillus laterosporus]TPH09926.1 XRE family transcriptional regulator [Brevibacillus laterosporus]